eukprot:gene9978-2153_t
MQQLAVSVVGQQLAVSVVGQQLAMPTQPFIKHYSVVLIDK